MQKNSTTNKKQLKINLLEGVYLRIHTGKKHPKNKLQRLQKSTNMNIWVVATSN